MSLCTKTKKFRTKFWGKDCVEKQDFYLYMFCFKCLLENHVKMLCRWLDFESIAQGST